MLNQEQGQWGRPGQLCRRGSGWPRPGVAEQEAVPGRPSSWILESQTPQVTRSPHQDGLQSVGQSGQNEDAGPCLEMTRNIAGVVAGPCHPSDCRAGGSEVPGRQLGSSARACPHLTGLGAELGGQPWVQSPTLLTEERDDQELPEGGSRALGRAGPFWAATWSEAQPQRTGWGRQSQAPGACGVSGLSEGPSPLKQSLCEMVVGFQVKRAFLACGAAQGADAPVTDERPVSVLLCTRLWLRRLNCGVAVVSV